MNSPQCVLLLLTTPEPFFQRQEEVLAFTTGQLNDNLYLPISSVIVYNNTVRDGAEFKNKLRGVMVYF